MSKKAKRRQRQKIKRNHTVEINNDKVQEDVDMLKAMKRLKSGKTSNEDIEGILQAQKKQWVTWLFFLLLYSLPTIIIEIACVVRGSKRVWK